ncbi:transporter [bacterium]|nr:transporter [bacterium]
MLSVRKTFSPITILIISIFCFEPSVQAQIATDVPLDHMRPSHEHQWTPLCANSFLSDGWGEPWIQPPSAGHSGAPRQGWLNTADGFFTREYHVFYGLTNNVELPASQTQDVHTGLYQLQLPLSRRLWAGLDVPFTSISDRPGNTAGVTKFDDIRITTKFMIQETRNHAISTELGLRVPTGDNEVGAGIGSLTPKINSWRDIGNAWSLRWAVGTEIFTEGISPGASDTDLLYNLALGKTLTPHEAAPWGDLTFHLSLNGRTNLNAVQNQTFLSLTPGIRTHLFDNIFLLSALEFPVSGHDSFDNRLLIQIVRGF